jgi:hypothetical protein
MMRMAQAISANASIRSPNVRRRRRGRSENGLHTRTALMEGLLIGRVQE